MEYLWNKISLKPQQDLEEEVTSISTSESTSTSDLEALLLTGQNWEFAQRNNLSFSKITNRYQSS
jgi:hypothetical protein